MEEDVLDSIADNPLGAAKEIKNEVRKLEKGYRKSLYQCVARAYAVAVAMAADEEAWDEFLEEDFWTERKKRPGRDAHKNALLNVMVFVFNSTGTYDRAWKYAKALEKSFHEEVSPETIEEVIKKNGGLEKMARAASGQNQDDEEVATKPRKAIAKHTSGEENKQSPESKEVKAAKSGGIGKSTPPDGTVKRRGPREYTFIASKKYGLGIRRLREGQKARITVEMVERHEELFPKVIAMKALKPLSH